jgi:hypothetical protein
MGFTAGTIAAGLLVVLAAPLGAQSEAPSGAAGPLADTLRAFAFRMAERLRRMDAPGVLALYGNPEQFVHIEAGHAIPWPRLSSMIREYFSTAPSNPVEIVGQPGVVLLDLNHAVLYVHHRMGSAGSRPGHEGMWTGVLRREPSGWTIVHSHSSDRAPAAPRQ